MEARRLHAAGLYASGVGRAEVARRLGVSWRAAHDWYARWRRDGAESLLSLGRPGRPSVRDAERVAALVRLLGGKTVAGAPRPTGPAGAGSRAPTRRARALELDHATRWERECLPDILRRAARQKRAAVYIDELLWPKGRERPGSRLAQDRPANVQHQFDPRVSGGNRNHRRLWLTHAGLHGAVPTGGEAIWLIRHLCSAIAGPMLLLWSGLGAYWAREARDRIASVAGPGRILVVDRPPAPAPETDPIRYLCARCGPRDAPLLCRAYLARLPSAAGEAFRGLRQPRGYIRAVWLVSGAASGET